MTTFYYWYPSERPFTSSAALLSALRQAGLGHALEDRITPRTCDKGPDGQKGTVACCGSNQDGRLGYWPEQQVWKQIPGSVAWCGMFSGDRPTPGDLARPDQITGEWLTLDDGHPWLVPKARRWVALEDRLLWDLNLPRRLTLADDGTWTPGNVKPKYERLWQLATAYTEADAKAQETADDDGAYRFSFEQIDELAIGALQVNYRVGPIELDLLGVYDDASRRRIIRVLLDGATWEAWVKKKLADLSGGSS
jgi:hypothetical protein